MTAGCPRAAQLAGLHIGVGQVRVDLLTEDGVTCVGMALDPAGHRALPALLALHAHNPGCPGHADVHVGLLLGVAQALGGGCPQVVVRRGADPPLWLRLPGRGGTELPLGTLDACGLLCSGRVRIVVELAHR